MKNKPALRNPILTRAMNDGIKNFQKDRGLKVDGIMKPSGETERGLIESLTGSNAAPIPPKKPIPPETFNPTFDIDKAPVFNKEEIRQEILLNNTPAQFEIKENPKLANPTLTEKMKRIFVKDDNIGSKVVMKHEQTIEKISIKHGVDPDLTKAVMWADRPLRPQ